MNKQMYVMVLLYCFAALSIKGQQNPTFTEYNYNPFIINSAYAGNSGDAEANMSSIGFGNHGVAGTPKTFAFTFHTPLKKNKMGLGAGVIHDEIGVTTTTQVFGAYSYKIILNDNAYPYWKIFDRSFISFGIQAGALLYNQDLLSLGLQDDINFAKNINSTLPTAGVGALFGHANFFAGVSLPNLIGDNFANPYNIKISRPVYGYIGYHFILGRFSSDFILKPSLLFKQESGAPFQIDANLSLSIKNMFEIGAGFRTSSIINAMAGFYVSQNIRMLYSYTHGAADSPLGNTHGLILSYRFGDGFHN